MAVDNRYPRISRILAALIVETSLMLYRIGLLVLGLAWTSGVLGANFRLGLLHGDDQVFDYELSVIRLALANAPGEHTLEIVPLPEVPQNRIFAMLNEEPSKINVFFSGYSPERETRLLQVDIPLTRGLLGYRLFAVKADQQARYAEVDTLADLQQLSIGSGVGWPENTIMRQNGLTLITSQYANLWRMLAYGRFDLFHRGVQEIYTELHRQAHRNLAVLPNIALVFRYDYFLYVPRHREDLHDILLTGLLNAYENGAFMANFEAHPSIRAALDRSDLGHRRLIRLQIPETSQTLNEIPIRFWHRPELSQR